MVLGDAIQVYFKVNEQTIQIWQPMEQSNLVAKPISNNISLSFDLMSKHQGRLKK